MRFTLVKNDKNRKQERHYDLRLQAVRTELRVTIDVGSPAIARAAGISGNSSIIDFANPANANGIITSLEIWVVDTFVGLKVGTFFLVSGTTYQCRDSVTIANTITAGSKQTVSGLSLSIQVGDFIGFYKGTGEAIEKDNAGSGLGYVSGDQLTPGNQSVYNTAFYPTGAISLYGTGTTLL